MILYYENYKYERIKIAETKTEEEAIAALYDFLKNHNYTSYYLRSWINEENSKEKYLDFGSHVEFCLIYNEEGWETNGTN